MKSWLFSLSLLVPFAGAQNAFVAVDGGTVRRITRVETGSPWSERDGKLTSEFRSKVTLAKAPVYLPGYVTFSDLEVVVSHLEDLSGGRLNYDLRIKGKAQSESAAAHCFMVLELNLGKATGLVHAGLPDLPAGKAVPIDVTFKLADQLDEGSYSLHLFAEGNELLHSKMSSDYVAAQRRKTDALLKDKRDYPAIVARAVPAVYPPDGGQATGSVKVRCRVAASGAVADATVLSATLPAFGEAALVAIRKWKFDPALKNLRPVESTVETSFTFAPPAKTGSSKPPANPTK